MEIIVEDFINGHQERKVVPDDTVFISKDGKYYYEFVSPEDITAEKGYIINTAYGYELNKKDTLRYLVFQIDEEQVPRDENSFKHLMKKHNIRVPEEKKAIW